MGVIDNIRIAIQTRDSEALEAALFDEMPASEESAELLVQLLNSDWHYKHEDIVIQMQRMKNPLCVKALRNAAERKYDYLSYDNSEALARKCTWAIADIGTPEAKGALEELSASSDIVVASFANRRLEKWDSEIGRKGT